MEETQMVKVSLRGDIKEFPSLQVIPVKNVYEAIRTVVRDK